MSKRLNLVICVFVIVVINRIECIRLTKDNVFSLGGWNGELSSKKISEIDPAALEGITSTYLNLGGNELTEIPESLFERKTKFETIYLHFNKISFLQPKTFRNLKDLVYLNAGYNQLTSFDFNLLSSSKELNELYLHNNSLTEINYSDLKLRFPNLASFSFSYNKFNCSFAKQLKDYLDREHISEAYGSISCISDAEYAAIVRDRHINTPVKCECTNMQLNMEKQCNNITMELQNDNAKVKDEREKLKIIIEEMDIVIKGLKSQLLEQQSIIEKGKGDCEEVKIGNVNTNNEIKGLKLQMQVESEKVKINFDDVENEMKGLKSQFLQLKAVTESCCQMTF